MEATFRVPVMGAVISTCRFRVQGKFRPGDFVSGDSLLEGRGMRGLSAGSGDRDEHRAGYSLTQHRVTALYSVSVWWLLVLELL